MKMRKVILAVMAIALMVTPALASEKAAQKMDIETFMANNPFHGPAMDGRDYFEGFEGGVMPPAGWTVGTTNVAGLTWTIGATSAGLLEGAATAYCPYDITNFSDETMSFDQMIDVAGGEYVLSFFMAGALGTDWDLNVAETVEVNGTTVFDFDSNVTASFVFEQYFVDLSAYDGQMVNITFRYAGIDGDLHVVDAVMVDDGTGYVFTPPEAPENDTCDGAIEILPGAFSFMTDNTLAANDYPLASGSCTGYSATGNDVVYYAYLETDELLEVSMQCGFDASLYIITDCADPMGSCVAGADDTVSEGLEEISFMAPADGLYYIIVSAYSSGTGPIEVYGTNHGGGIATEPTTFDGLKSLYR
jgi:hypothetical protein